MKRSHKTAYKSEQAYKKEYTYPLKEEEEVDSATAFRSQFNPAIARSSKFQQDTIPIKKRIVVPFLENLIAGHHNQKQMLDLIYQQKGKRFTDKLVIAYQELEQMYDERREELNEITSLGLERYGRQAFWYGVKIVQNVEKSGELNILLFEGLYGKVSRRIAQTKTAAIKYVDACVSLIVDIATGNDMVLLSLQNSTDSASYREQCLKSSAAMQEILDSLQEINANTLPQTGDTQEHTGVDHIHNSTGAHQDETRVQRAEHSIVQLTHQEFTVLSDLLATIRRAYHEFTGRELTCSEGLIPITDLVRFNHGSTNIATDTSSERTLEDIPARGSIQERKVDTQKQFSENGRYHGTLGNPIQEVSANELDDSIPTHDVINEDSERRSSQTRAARLPLVGVQECATVCQVVSSLSEKDEQQVQVPSQAQGLSH